MRASRRALPVYGVLLSTLLVGCDVAEDFVARWQKHGELGPCRGPNPSGCASDADCRAGEYCRKDPEICVSSACSCDAQAGGWFCTGDCSGGVCECRCSLDAGSAQACTQPNPAGCTSHADCASGEICAHDPEVCLSSACHCDPATGAWICTPDCYGGVCQPAAVLDAGNASCNGPNPAGCSTNADCDAGEACSHDEESCLPSACGCDPATGSWICTADCGGGVCRPAP